MKKDLFRFLLLVLIVGFCAYVQHNASINSQKSMKKPTPVEDFAMSAGY